MGSERMSCRRCGFLHKHLPRPRPRPFPRPFPALGPCPAIGLAWAREGCRELLLQQLHGQGDNGRRRQAAEAVQRQQPGPRGQARKVGLEAAGGSRGVEGGGMVVEEGVGARGVSVGCGMTCRRRPSRRLFRAWCT